MTLLNNKVLLKTMTLQINLYCINLVSKNNVVGYETFTNM